MKERPETLRQSQDAGRSSSEMYLFQEAAAGQMLLHNLDNHARA